MVRENAEFETKIVDAIYRAACDTSEWSRAVAMMAQYFSSPGGTLAVIDVDALSDVNQKRAQGQLLITCGVVDAGELERYHDYAHLDPIPPIFNRLPPGTVTTSNRVLSSDKRNIFRNEFLAPLGVDENLGGPLFRADGRCAALSLLKGINQQAFGDKDIACLSRLLPHVTRAVQIGRLLWQSEAHGKMLQSIVDRNAAGMMGLAHDGTTLFVNTAARAIAAARDGMGIDRSGRIVVADRAAATRLAALHGDVLRGGAGGLAVVPRPSGQPPYAVLISRLPTGGDLFPPGVLFAIHDPMRRPATTAQQLMQLLRIPLAAAKLVQALLEGIDLKEYAGRAGISINTVRSHLKMAFARTETRSQADLMRKALLALNDLGPYFAVQKR